MSYSYRLSQSDRQLVDFLNACTGDDVVLGMGVWEDIYMTGLALMLRYGWTQEQLQNTWPTLFLR